MSPAPAPAPAMDVEGDGGSGAKSQSNVVAVKSEAACAGVMEDDGRLVDAPEPASARDQGGDTTECSSSFGGTCSGFADDADDGDPEVNSGISSYADGDGPSKPPRRKKVTAEWRNAVRPLLWRCQWLELRMKDLSSQVSKYDRELALIKKEKEAQQEANKGNGSTSEQMQIHKGHLNNIMKRRKRKRHEDSLDTSLYINKHQILSYYYDKQNKGAENEGFLIDDDCGSPVYGGIRGGLDTATLLDAEDYDMIFEQLTLKDILLTIDGVQSQVHLLQDRLSNACSEGENLAFSEDNTHFRVARKRHSTQKRTFSYKTCRYTKPQKRKNLNILLKDDDGPAPAVRPALSDRETNTLIKDANKNAEEKSAGRNHSREKAITMDLLLGTDNSICIPNGHLGDLCKESADDILIDNQAANEGCQHFEEVRHLPSEAPSNGISAPAELKDTSAPVKVDSTSAPVVKQESLTPGNKKGWKSKKKKKGFSNKKQSKEGSRTPAAKEKSESTRSAATEQETLISLVKKRKTVDESADAKKHKSGNSPSASKKQKTGNSSSGPKKRKTEKSTPAAKKLDTGKPSSATKQENENPCTTGNKKETEGTPSKLKVEKAVLVAVNSRRSQRVRKPKVFAE